MPVHPSQLPANRDPPPNSRNPQGIACLGEEDAVAWTLDEGINFNPGIMGNQPCIAGRRVPTWIINSAAEASDSIPKIAEDYSISETQVQQTPAWEQRLPPPRQQRKRSDNRWHVDPLNQSARASQTPHHTKAMPKIPVDSAQPL